MIEKLTDDTYEYTLGQQRIAIVKVYANWCGPCKFLNTFYDKWSETFSNVDGVDIPFYKLENDANRKFIKQYKVDRLPSIIFFVYGVPVFTLQGVTRQAVMEKMIKQTLEIKFERK